MVVQRGGYLAGLMDVPGTGVCHRVTWPGSSIGSGRTNHGSVWCEKIIDDYDRLASYAA